MENEERIAKRHMPGVIKRYRALAGYSQQQLADSMGVSKGFISALEGGRSVPNLDMLVVLATALNVRPGELVDSMVEGARRAQEAQNSPARKAMGRPDGAVGGMRRVGG